MSSLVQIHNQGDRFCVYANSLSLSLSFSLLASLPVPKKKPRGLSISVVMAATTGSNYESDEEFEERTSDKLSTFYFGEFGDVVAELEHELGQKRFDRVKKLVQVQKVLRPDREFLRLLLQRLVNDAVRHMLASGCPDKLHFIFSHYGDKVSQHDQKKMFLQEVLYGSDDSVDTLHNLVGHSFVQKVCTELERRGVWSGVCCKLLQACMSGDLLEVERCLAVEEVGSGYGLSCPHFGEKFAIAAAQCGHTHVVKTLLKWQSRRNDRSVKWMVAWQQEEVLWIACRNGNVDLAVSMLWAMDIVWSRKPPRRRSERLMRPEVICTAKFLKKVVTVIMERLDNAGLKMNPRWFEQVLDDAIKFRKRHHVEALLDQVDPDRCGINFVDQPWLMPAVFRSRCASILVCILIRYREAAIDKR